MIAAEREMSTVERDVRLAFFELVRTTGGSLDAIREEGGTVDESRG